MVPSPSGLIRNNESEIYGGRVPPVLSLTRQIFRIAALGQEIALIEIGKRLSAERRAASARAKERSPS